MAGSARFDPPGLPRIGGVVKFRVGQIGENRHFLPCGGSSRSDPAHGKRSSHADRVVTKGLPCWDRCPGACGADGRSERPLKAGWHAATAWFVQEIALASELYGARFVPPLTAGGTRPVTT